MAKNIIPNATKLVLNYCEAVCNAGASQGLQLLAAALMCAGWEFADTHAEKVIIKAAHKHFPDGAPGFVTLSKSIGADLESIPEDKLKVGKVAFSRFLAKHDLGLKARKGAGGRKTTAKKASIPEMKTIISAVKGGVYTAKELEALEAILLAGKAKARKTA